MYTKTTKISEPVGNNAFSYEKRKNKELFIPSITQGDFRDIKIGNKIAFEDFDENGNLKTCVGLKSFIRTEFQGVPVIIMDNHNHAFYFWHEAREQGVIQDGATLVHIDQHSDMREPESFLSPQESRDLQRVFDYTNQILNVGNFIIPAQKTGLINQIIQIRGETDLQGVNPTDPTDPALNRNKVSGSVANPTDRILDLDLDFFAPELDYIDFNLAKQVILNLARQASLITIATSPFFIDQKLALQKLHNLFL